MHFEMNLAKTRKNQMKYSQKWPLTDEHIYQNYVL